MAINPTKTYNLRRKVETLDISYLFNAIERSNSVGDLGAIINSSFEFDLHTSGVNKSELLVFLVRYFDPWGKLCCDIHPVLLDTYLAASGIWIGCFESLQTPTNQPIARGSETFVRYLGCGG